jgi:hypothetical protein
MWVVVATEDEPSEAVAVRLVGAAGCSVLNKLRRGGFGYLKSNLRRFAELARTYPVVVLTDLDNRNCPVDLVAEWTQELRLPSNLHLRVAVREIEAWLLADREGFAAFLGVSERRIPYDVETVRDPKALVMQLAERARSDLRRDLLPPAGAIASQGLGYSSRLAEFAREHWNMEAARLRAPSLDRAMCRLANAGWGPTTD